MRRDYLKWIVIVLAVVAMTAAVLAAIVYVANRDTSDLCAPTTSRACFR